MPAFRLLGTVAGDETFKRLVEWVHKAPPRVIPEKVPLGTCSQLWGASLPEDEARPLAGAVLMAVHDKPSAARLNGRLVRDRVLDVDLSLTRPRLVMVPVDRQDEDLVIPGTEVRFPALLLEGGPQLEALRETVHKLAARR